MTEKTCPTKAELLAALRASRDEVVATIRGLPAEALEGGRYEGGWNGRQILAHLASIEWTYPRLIEIARDAGAAGPAAPAPPTRAMRGGNDAYNERQVAKRAHLTPAALLEEFERNRAATIRAVEAVDEALLARTIRSAGGVTGPLALVFHRVAVEHVRGHLLDIGGPEMAPTPPNVRGTPA
jgi:Mycothiol maleylpyruvate isomerase N-terminal domain